MPPLPHHAAILSYHLICYSSGLFANPHPNYSLRLRHGLEKPEPELLALHNAWVRRTVPPERLLEVDLASGWAPLCAFLGKPVPDEPFPRVNDGQARDEFMRAVMWKAGAAWIGIFSVLAVGGVSLARWYRRN